MFPPFDEGVIIMSLSPTTARHLFLVYLNSQAA